MPAQRSIAPFDARKLAGLLVLILAPLATAQPPGGESGTASAGLPVVFVPGTSGSLLKLPDGTLFWLDSNSIWPGRTLRGQLNQAGGDEGVEQVTPAGVLDAVQFALPPSVTAELARFELIPLDKLPNRLPVYADFSRWGRTKFGPSGWYEVAYDWRKGAGAEASAQIDAVVTRAMQEQGGRKVILVAHSLGGLVCRDYIGSLGRGKVDALVSVGTPWLGAPKTARGLTWGYNFGVGFAPPPSRFVSSLYWYLKDPTHPGQLTRATPPLRLTFLDNNDTSILARNYPCVFQQLSMADFVEFFGKSPIFGLTPEQAQAKLRSYNPRLFDAAVAWRQEHLKADNYGVAHHAIAAYLDPGGDPGEFQDMQFALPGPDSLTADGSGGLRDDANKFIIAKRRQIFTDLKARGVPLYLDEFIATETSADSGDGTAPLLSASAGAQVRADAPLDPTRAARFLGPDVDVRVLQLESPYSHGSMVNDLGVRQEVLRVVSARQQASGLPTRPEADEVGVMILELTTKPGSMFNGTIDTVTMNVVGTDFLTNNVFFQDHRFDSPRLTSGTTARYYYHYPRIKASGTLATQPMTRSEALRSPLRLSKAGYTNWTCAGVRLLLDGRVVVDSREEFTLNSAHPSWEIAISPQVTAR